MQREMVARARRHLLRRDPVLAGVIRTVGPCRWADGTSDLFTGLVRAIASQQLSSKAADTILGRVHALLADERLAPESLLAIPRTSLRAAGLSERKTEYLHDVAGRFQRGELRQEMLDVLSDEEVIRALTEVRGVGRWTAEMILIFRLRRPDVLPLDDVALMRAVKRAYGLRRTPTPKQFTRIAEAWRPWRSVACWYLWASLE
jgi:DNA-3-methyladenine glycosylase II